MRLVEWMRLGAVSLMVTLGCEPGRSEQGATREQLVEHSASLYVRSGITLWDTGSTIPVCWITPGFDAEKAIIVQVLRDTWESYGNITFGGFNLCPTTGTDRFVRVMVELGTDAWGGGSSRIGQ